jgi:hypothetical protein
MGGVMDTRSHEDTAAAKRDLIDAIANNELTLGQAVRGMRKISGLSQKAYAERSRRSAGRSAIPWASCRIRTDRTEGIAYSFSEMSNLGQPQYSTYELPPKLPPNRWSLHRESLPNILIRKKRFLFRPGAVAPKSAPI